MATRSSAAIALALAVLAAPPLAGAEERLVVVILVLERRSVAEAPARQLAGAAAIAERHGARVVVWFERDATLSTRSRR